MNDFKILDCTLRDGGYYTDWYFNKSLVRDLVKSLDNSGVEIIEMGYKSPIKGGPYRKCNDGFIKSVVDFDINAKLAFMIDVKDFLVDSKINTDLMLDVIKPSNTFKICRVAAKYHEIEYLPEIVNLLQSLGYEVICNIMATSLLSKNQINDFTNITEKLNLTAIYIADSYGALYPNNVSEIFNNPKINGIHTHDNMGLAFANCIAAIDKGAEYIDGTITGMGRGVGNVTTEQLIAYNSTTSINSNLLNVIDKFLHLKSQYKWGTNPLYHKAGQEHIHPLYLQDLNQSNLSNKQILEVLDDLSGNNSYDDKLLEELKQQKAVVVIPARYKSSRFPGKPLAKINGKEMILHVAEKAEQAVGKENVYIATENQSISKVVKSAGYKVVLTSDNCLTGTDRVAEAAQEIKADIFINVQGDEPMIDPNDILKVIKAKQANPEYVINCMSNLHPNEDINDKKIPKVICDLRNNLLYSSRNAIPGTKEGNSKGVKKQVCIYGFSKNQLNKFKSNIKTPLESQEDIEILRFIENGIPVKMVEVDKVSYAVDYPDDIKVIENLKITQ